MPALLALPAHGLVLAASAASTASTASAARPGGFDPASTLGWAVPLLLAAPLVAYVVVLFSVRGRRAASNLALLTAAVVLADTLLIGWARLRQPSPYQVAYQWINIPIAVTGDQRFQAFGVDLAFRIDHSTLLALVVVLSVFLGCLAWHRVTGRGEQGPIRFQANALLLMLGTVGVLISGDLTELLAFWLLTAVATYLLLGHRWGTEAAGWRGRVALAVPAIGDVALLCALGVLYSRFGQLNPDKLFPVLHTSVGVGLRSLTLTAVLLIVAIVARAAVWPFTVWQTATVDAPAGAVALVAGVWPPVAGMLLLRVLPLIGGAGVQAPRTAGYWLGVAAVVGPLLALVGVELRRSLLLASSGAVALALLGILFPASTAVAFGSLMAAAAGRSAALLAAASASSAMRTVDLREMGGAWTRMRGTAVGILIAALAMALAGAGAFALRPRSLAWLALGIGLALVALAVGRVYLVVAHGELRRRRAFEPGRVREAAAGAVGSALAVGLLGLVAAVLGFFTPWVAFLQSGAQAVAGMGTNVLWVASLLIGAAAAGLLFWYRRADGLDLAARLAQLTAGLWVLAVARYDRFLGRPGRRAIEGAETVGLPAVESGVARALLGTGGLADRALPWVPAVLGLAVVLAVAFGLLAPGIRR